MAEAATPADEAERLRALQQLNVLDTPLEERFERIVRIVRQTLDVPIAAVSLVDEHRQWFKSMQGLAVAETPRSVAFCAHAILEDRPLVVTDAATDARFAENPLVTADPNIRFYAGCPLTVGGGHRVGTLCAIDQVPRPVGEEQIAVLGDLAEIVAAELQRSLLSEANQRLVAELAAAERAALIDPLSRLWNRSGGEQMLAREWELALRDETPVGIMVVDIDGFAAVNAEHGREVGDAVIRHVGRTVSTMLRPYDVVARWDDDAFLVVAPKCDGAGLGIAANRVLHGIRQHPPELPSGEIPLTVSIGGAVVAAAAGDVDGGIAAAERALAAAQTTGGDGFALAAEAPARRVAGG